MSFILYLELAIWILSFGRFEVRQVPTRVKSAGSSSIKIRHDSYARIRMIFPLKEGNPRKRKCGICCIGDS
jgi:hypothetical protein